MKKTSIVFTNLVFLLVLFAVSTFGNVVSLDSTFNGTGYRLQAVGAGNANGQSIAIQTDGKIVMAGSLRVGNESESVSVIRVNTDGTLDTSFGSGGFAFSPAEVKSAFGIKVLLQPDGKILVGGGTYLTQPQKHAFTVIRFTSDGALDKTFNGTGYATGNVPGTFWDIGETMGLQADGKILVVGKTLNVPGQGTEWDIAVMRFTADGALDTTFDGDGIRKIGVPNVSEEGYSVLAQADGKILVGGAEITTVWKYLLTRLNADGSTDTSFAANGMTIFQLDFINNNFTSLALQSDGRILGFGGGKIVRFSPDGIRDMTFGSNGVQSGTGTIEPSELRVLDGDKFLIHTRNGVPRFMRDGAIDTHYSGSFTVSGNLCFMRSLAVQSDGKAVVGGYCSNNGDNIQRFALARFQEIRTKRYLDFSGDEKSDMSIFRPSNGQWWYLESRFLSSQIVAGPFGTATDKPVPADYTGDGRADVAVFRPNTGEWFILRSDNATFYSFQFGTSGDIPVAGEYDDDQLADAAVFRPSTNQWFIQKSTGGFRYETFGTTGDKLVPSDYDGDFKTDIAIYRPSNGEWWIQRSSDSSIYAFQFGNANDRPVQGDYTGDGKTDAAFWRPSTGEWFVLRSEDNSYFAAPFGLSDDLPTPGDFSGDARFDFAVFRPSERRWHILPSGGSYFYKEFGAPGDVPLPAMFVP